MAIAKRGLLKGIAGIASLGAMPAPLLARSEAGYPRLMQGPMLGAVSETDALVWARASGRFDVSLVLARDARFADAETVATAAATPENDYIVKLRASELEPGRTYYYRVQVDDRPGRYHEGLPPFSLTTAPAGPARFRVAFGSCARFQEYPDQPIWSALGEWRPDLFFWLGDNIYADSLEPRIIAECYRQQRSVAAFQSFGRHVPQLATWDDHDFGLNNHDRELPIKADSLAIFKRYWANPGAGTADTPGVFFAYRYGGVDFFFLDNRYHRSPNDDPDGPGKTQLGAAQKAWLKAGLEASDAPFKMVMAGGEWTRGKGEHGDSWAGYLHERDELLDFIRDRGIGGVVLLSGNVHRAELNVIPRSDAGGYDVYDLCSSPLAQDGSIPDPREAPEQRVRVPYSGGPNAGMIDFDLTSERPVLRFNIIDARGRAVREPFVLHADELVNGRRSWPEKVDPDLMPT